jgi:hypothetical protein
MKKVQVTEMKSTINFPRKAGMLYSRKAGKIRWRKYAKAEGFLDLEQGIEYRLKMNPIGWGDAPAAMQLPLAEIDRLVEIVVPIRVSSRDYMDQAISGNNWLIDWLKKAEIELQAALKTKAIIKVVPKT